MGNKNSSVFDDEEDSSSRERSNSVDAAHPRWKISTNLHPGSRINSAEASLYQEEGESSPWVGHLRPGPDMRSPMGLETKRLIKSMTALR